MTKMDTFGTIKNKILKKLTESYASGNKSEIKEIVSLIKKDKEFKDLYLFYEDIEHKHFDNTDVAKLYVENISNLLKDKKNLINETCEVLNEKLKDVIIEENSFYDALDQLLDIDTLKNVDKKVVAKKKIIEVLTTDKKNEVKESTNYTTNESLLYTVLTNNFNVLYEETLSEEEKIELQNILSLDYNEIKEKVTELKENINNKISNLLNESTDEDLNKKLNDVKKQVSESDISRYSYYKLTNLFKDLE